MSYERNNLFECVGVFVGASELRRSAKGNAYTWARFRVSDIRNGDNYVSFMVFGELAERVCKLDRSVGEVYRLTFHIRTQTYMSGETRKYSQSLILDELVRYKDVSSKG